MSASYNLAFSMLTGIVKKLLKQLEVKRKNINKLLLWSKLNSTESKISEALTCSEISHEDVIQLLMKKKKCWELKESIRMMNSQKSDTEKINFIEESKKIG